MNFKWSINIDIDLRVHFFPRFVFTVAGSVHQNFVKKKQTNKRMKPKRRRRKKLIENCIAVELLDTKLSEMLLCDPWLAFRIHYISCYKPIETPF